MTAIVSRPAGPGAAPGSVSVVSVTASEEGWRADSHLLVLPSSVVLVDAPLLDRDADAVERELAAVRKPLGAVIVTHPHPDHFATAARFGAPVRALPAVAAAIEKAGAQQIAASYAVTGISDAPPPAPRVEPTILPGPEVIDGVLFEFAEVEDAEASRQLVVRLPAEGVLVTGDLASAGVHPFLAGRALRSWRAGLDALRSPAVRVLLPGHGIPSPDGAAVLDATADYLQRAEPELTAATGPHDLDTRLDAAFPDLGGRRMHALQNVFLFP
jgi:glyoxylase-like metal-dependent hydrolase (beta-lactamase superfamily II)